MTCSVRQITLMCELSLSEMAGNRKMIKYTLSRKKVGNVYYLLYIDEMEDLTLALAYNYLMSIYY